MPMNGSSIYGIIVKIPWSRLFLEPLFLRVHVSITMIVFIFTNWGIIHNYLYLYM